MKVCPKCARSFAEGFQFCPQDAAELVKYNLRAQLTQNEFQFLLEEESFPRRLAREFADAVDELKHNPKSFLAGLMRGETSNRRRKQLLQAGLASAVIAYAAVMMAGVLVGLFTSPVQLIEAKEPGLIKAPSPFFEIVPIFKPKLDEGAQSLKRNAGKLGGSFNRQQDSGGGGGANDQSPARAGVPTQASLFQLRPPDLDPPRINPTLVTPMTVVADPNAFLKLRGPIGDWRGKGSEDSLGNSGRNGIGNGTGDGYSDGNKFGVGGNDPRLTSGKPSGNGNDIPFATRDMRPTITYKERARYTEEARQIKLQGTVVLSLVFGADGRVYDIRVVRHLPGGLTEEAILAAQKIRFNPAVRDGRAVSVRMQLEYNFTLY
jgi:TonB family protein